MTIPAQTLTFVTQLSNQNIVPKHALTKTTFFLELLNTFKKPVVTNGPAIANNDETEL